MSIYSAKSRNFSTNSLFAVFSLGIIGWGLLHAWGITVKTNMLFHAVAAVPGLTLSGLALYRYRQHWPLSTASCDGQHEPRLKLSWDYRAVAIYLLLVAIGFSIAVLIGGGSLFLLILGAVGMVVVPWSRIAVCRDHFFFASAMVGAGALLGLVVLRGPVHPLYYPMAALLLLAVACSVLISVIAVHGNRRERMPTSGY